MSSKDDYDSQRKTCLKLFILLSIIFHLGVVGISCSKKKAVYFGFSKCSKIAECAPEQSKVAPLTEPPQYSTSQSNYPEVSIQACRVASIEPPMPEIRSEEYADVPESKFLDVSQNPLSTFSVDVDTASYANIRRFINGGTLPPKESVRIEEMINYFDYNYPNPSGEDPISITTEVSKCPWNSRHQLALIGLQAKKMNFKETPPANFVFLIDVSGSMEDDTKLPLLKSAFRLLVNELRPQDKVAIVTYSTTVSTVLNPTGGAEKTTIINAIDSLRANGSTAGGAGIQTAYEVAEKNLIKDGNNRVILATDGDFNVGITDPDILINYISEKKDKGIFISILGFGMANIKDARLEKIADKGNGNYSYIDNISEARKVFVSGISGTLCTVARDVKVQIEFNPGVVKSYRLIGYENRMLDKEDFNDDKKDAGEVGAGHTVTALYEIVSAGSDEENGERPEVDKLKYQPADPPKNIVNTDEVMNIKVRYKPPKTDESKLIVKPLLNNSAAIENASENFRFAASVAEFGLLLSDSQYKKNASYEDVISMAMNAKGKDEDGYRAEFIKLCKDCQSLTGENKN